MKWIPLSERKPTAEDGDDEGRLLVRCQDGWIVTRIWSDRYWLESSNATHFARLRDIELPPPAPVMPERLEFVKASPGEVGSMRDIAIRNRDECTICGAGHWTSGHTLYRRVSPGNRIVLEVVGPGVPKKGEWFVNYGRSEVSCCSFDWELETRTILRLVEGQEYLK